MNGRFSCVHHLLARCGNSFGALLSQCIMGSVKPLSVHRLFLRCIVGLNECTRKHLVWFWTPLKMAVPLSSRDGSRFSNILFNYRISIRLCDYFLKVYQGLTIKTVRWREGRSDLSLTRSGHCRWSLYCIICMRF